MRQKPGPLHLPRDAVTPALATVAANLLYLAWAHTKMLTDFITKTGWKPRKAARMRFFLAAIVLFVSAALHGQSGVAPIAASSQLTNTLSVSDTVAAEMELAAFQKSLTNQIRAMAEKQAGALHAGDSHPLLWTGAAVLLAAMVGLVRYVPRFFQLANNQAETRLASAGADAQVTATLLAEEQSVSDFAAKFRTGPTAARAKSVASITPQLKDSDAPAAPKTRAQELFDSAPKRLLILRNYLHQLGHAAEEPTRQLPLQKLVDEIASLKLASEFPEVLPVWQMASALEALAKHLLEKTRNVTPSVLRTFSSAINLLEKLCAPGIKAELMADPPLRVLAVDDDPLSRHAVSFALKRALRQPDMAANGEAALALAAQIGYDAIFLDVQMPGMDGFEACAKIRETPHNKSTPVVFVTCQADAESRARAEQTGAQDVIAKPFLIFEITLKALTLVMNNRLETSTAKRSERREEVLAV